MNPEENSLDNVNNWLTSGSGSGITQPLNLLITYELLESFKECQWVSTVEPLGFKQFSYVHSD
jgi:hypothetical protein